MYIGAGRKLTELMVKLVKVNDLGTTYRNIYRAIGPGSRKRRKRAS